MVYEGYFQINYDHYRKTVCSMCDWKDEICDMSERDIEQCVLAE